MEHHEHVDTAGSGDYTPGYYEILERSIAELLVEKGRIGAGEIRRKSITWSPETRRSAHE